MNVAVQVHSVSSVAGSTQWITGRGADIAEAPATVQRPASGAMVGRVAQIA
ncbi:hypothetical protein AB0J80_26860 [Actinoplanes sp. NPDC049548]|uniref:hypothetical protein n=1 Tax=Actinoplanes sp. NPDC049548 TaxID=3155152 RepID=UPI003430EBBD